jgi:hypothetical protein
MLRLIADTKLSALSRKLAAVSTGEHPLVKSCALGGSSASLDTAHHRASKILSSRYQP